MRRILQLFFLLLLVVGVSPALAATPTGLAVTHRQGQSFITFTEAGCPAGSYKIWRRTSQVTSEASATLIATLDQDSGRWLYNDVSSLNLTSGFIITDLGSHLSSTTGLMVNTTHVGETGNWYYGVDSTCDTTFVGGTNALTTPVAETYQAVTGAIQVTSSVVGPYTTYSYFAWEDYSTWDTAEWGYYGHQVNVARPTSGSNFPLTTELHAAGNGGWFNTGFRTTNLLLGVTIKPMDYDWSGSADPYTGTGHAAGWWQVQFNTAADLYIPSVENRVVHYAKMVRDNLTGDGVDFSIDASRLYLTGASMGSGVMHIASHYPLLFAATETQIGWVDNVSKPGFPNDSTKHVNTPSGPLLRDYMSMAYQAAHTTLPMILHQFSAADTTINEQYYPVAIDAFETNHQPYQVEWMNTDHSAAGTQYTQWTMLRFKSNEAYPAFSSVATSTTVPAMPSATFGQRNGFVDWDSSLHDLSGGVAGDIYDKTWRFSITMRATSALDTIGTVTIRNLQNYHPPIGSTILWSTKAGYDGSGANIASGTIVVGANYALTVADITIKTTGMRLTFEPLNDAWADYSGLPLCSVYGTSASALSASWTITAPTTVVPASTDNFKVIVNGTTWDGHRAFIFVTQGAELWILTLNDRWYQILDTVGNHGSAKTAPDGPGCRLPTSADGTSVLQSNSFLVDSLGGQWIAACREDADDPSKWGDWCPWNFAGATIEEAVVVRNGARFYDVANQRSMMEPNNAPWNLKWCGGEMYKHDYDPAGITHTYSKWAGIGIGPWIDSTTSSCVTGGAVGTKHRIRLKQ